ncbi:MAG: hypothetical protein M1833_007151 [Piccolia ochrophora]|nr:MAG: hypothetical protein M1833_007151 [Piccolia ochrophora]
MTLPDAGAFSAPAEVHHFAGFLFDMDGTLCDSTQAIIKHWHKIGAELGVDPNTIMATSHGRRSIDTLRLYDPSKANWKYISEIEGQIPQKFGQDAKEIPGARHILSSLDRIGAPWAIVTSGTQALVDGWLDVLQLARPRHLVVAEDVETGKPDPACYRLGRERLGLAAQSSVLVVEDSPAGIIAGKAAGCKVLGLTTTHSVEQVKEARPDWIVENLQSVTVRRLDDKATDVEVVINNALLDE